MSSKPSSLLSASKVKETLLEILGQVQEEEESRLRQQAEALRVPDLAEVWDLLNAMDPNDLVQEWAEANPSLPILNLRRMEPFKVATGILKLVSPERG